MIQANSVTLHRHIENDACNILYFWSIECLICSKVEQFLIQLEQVYKIQFIKIDITNNIKLVQKFDIQSVPTFIVFQKSVLKAKIIGFRNNIDFEKQIRNLIK